jgi:uncharacterized membrane protein HdeD (DUF308 family)
MRIEIQTEEMHELSRGWWLFVLIGAASVVAGGILVAKPSNSLTTLAVVFGIFLLLDGIIELVGSFTRPPGSRALAAIVGVFAIIVGIVLIRHPTHAVTAIGLVIGIWLVAAGVIRLVIAIAIGQHVIWRVVIALLEIVVGVAIVSDPHIGYATLAVLTGIWLIVSGIGTIALGVAARGARAESTSLS